MQDFSLEFIKELKGSQLRQEFETIEGKLKSRKVELERITPEIVDLHQRPAYCPSILVFQFKKVSPELAWVCSEVIFTSNAFLNEFEDFLRRNAISVPAKGFEDTPEEYLSYFETPFSLVPVDISRASVALTSPDKGEKVVIQCDRFKGVDFASSCTLKMMAPEVLYKGLERIERIGNFSVVIEKVLNGVKNECVEAFEYRRGNENVTVDHFVFRKKVA